MNQNRVVITGMSINTPLGDNLGTFYENLIAGRSGITEWKFFKHNGVLSKIGGDLSDYDFTAKTNELKTKLPPDMFDRFRKLVKKAPFSTKFSLICAADAWLDANLDEDDNPTLRAVLVGGHNLNDKYLMDNHSTFMEEPDYIDGLMALLSLDTDQAASVSEVLGWMGPAYTLGGACASGNIAMRNAMDEIRHHDCEMAMVVGPVLQFSEMGVHSMALMGAISFSKFNDQPAVASRPFDKEREGFVPSHGAGAIVLENLEHALKRNADIYAEVLEVVATAEACHLPNPSMEGQARTISSLLQKSNVKPEEIDFVSGHSTSTPLGDISELKALKKVFGDHAKNLKINAPKSMLGHTCWSAPLVETVATVLQMRHNKLHPSINIDNLDPEVDLDICANKAIEHEVNFALKNSFGFGGISCCSLLKRFDVNSA